MTHFSAFFRAKIILYPVKKETSKKRIHLTNPMISQSKSDQYTRLVIDGESFACLLVQPLVNDTRSKAALVDFAHLGAAEQPSNTTLTYSHVDTSHVLANCYTFSRYGVTLGAFCPPPVSTAKAMAQCHILTKRKQISELWSGSG